MLDHDGSTILQAGRLQLFFRLFFEICGSEYFAKLYLSKYVSICCVTSSIRTQRDPARAKRICFCEQCMLPTVRTRALTHFMCDSDLHVFEYYKKAEGFFILSTILINKLAVCVNQGFIVIESRLSYEPSAHLR